MNIQFLGTSSWFDNDTGNTTCVLIDSPEAYIILDAGFGIAKIDQYITEKKPIFLFLSHYHLDHTCGLHVWPKFNFPQGITIIGGNGLKKNLRQLVRHPFTASFSEAPGCPVKLMSIKDRAYRKPLRFEAKQLTHIDPCMGYRFQLDGKTIAFCTDTGPDENIVALGKKADLLILECSFSSGKTSNWGHLNPEQCAEYAKKTEAKQLVMIHFGPDSYTTLEKRKEAEKIVQNVFPNAKSATDGLKLEI